MGRRKLIAGNWKMNCLRADGTALAGAIASDTGAVAGAAVDVLVCPPATLLTTVAAAIAGRPVALGAQDCHASASGAHTGDVSAPMLADVGCTYVIVGHSERRHDHGETDATVRAKATAARAAGLIAIVCVGETEAERNADRHLAVVERQVLASIPDDATAADTVVAYEPVWAIGTGRTATAADIAEMHAHIRALLARRLASGADVRILYGGSVKPGNATEIMAVADVDGALVGGASLKAEDFRAIVRSCG
jgi:triosephosphate isomerase (TIM)